MEPLRDRQVGVTSLYDGADEIPPNRRMRSLARFVRADNGSGTSHTDPGAQGDRIATFAPAVLALRWSTTSISLALAATAFVDQEWNVITWCIGLVSYTAIRSITPIRYIGGTRSLVEVIVESGLHVAAVVATGFWESPFVLSLLTAIVVAGFARGFGFALRLAMTAALAISLADAWRRGYDGQDVRLAIQWAVVLGLVGVVAGYARRISGEADRRQSLAMDRLEQLSNANALLHSLHRVAQTLPASLDLADVVETTVARLRSLVNVDAVALLLLDETDHSWQVIRREGLALPARLARHELPTLLLDSLSSGGIVHNEDLRGPGGPGLSPTSLSGLYMSLSARGSVIGLLAVEAKHAGAFGLRERELLEGFVAPVALAIDNARLFSRLRIVGADEERTRIARDLHDNIGQSLAYLGLELDRIVDKEHRGESLDGLLPQLRRDLRNVVGEVRETLYDLRTDITDTEGLGDVLGQFATRLAERSDLVIELHIDADSRLPLRQEREMWHIAQEALVNVERHSDARTAMVHWRCCRESATLEIVDDGKGFLEGDAGRVDSYGIVGMRERAASIGATFEINSGHGRGTTIRCTLTADRDAGQEMSKRR